MAKRSYRELSQANWMSELDTIDRINAGSLQRIADASEKTAAGFEAVLKRLAEVEKERDQYKNRYFTEMDLVII